ncbi:YqhA family protein [Amaricoccus macauensis]|uniref:YqhA family protein n=1 Tax=Amaricoccus macauensis TaxID=57001 RepID=UPI003C7A202D
MPELNQDMARRLLRRTVITTYWLQVPLLLGLVLALVLFGLTFFHGIIAAVSSGTFFDRHQSILLVLDLLDMIFIANLISMVMVSGYNTLFSALDEEDGSGGITERDGFGAMKPRIAATIVIISAIHLLHEVMEDTLGDWRNILMLTVVHLALLGTAAVLMLLRRN